MMISHSVVARLIDATAGAAGLYLLVGSIILSFLFVFAAP